MSTQFYRPEVPGQRNEVKSVDVNDPFELAGLMYKHCWRAYVRLKDERLLSDEEIARRLHRLTNDNGQTAVALLVAGNGDAVASMVNNQLLHRS